MTNTVIPPSGTLTAYGAVLVTGVLNTTSPLTAAKAMSVLFNNRDNAFVYICMAQTQHTLTVQVCVVMGYKEVITLQLLEFMLVILQLMKYQ